jgi:hypothetical protein
MGGFMIYDDDDQPRLLLSHDLKRHLSEGDINVSEKEIKDKSKGDMLSKGIVLLQTGWFILQLISRGVQRLPVAELELVTLAFAILNFVTYGLWWYKPLDVQCPIIVRKRIPLAQNSESGNAYGGQRPATGPSYNVAGGPSVEPKPSPGVGMLPRIRTLICQAPKAAWRHTFDAADFLFASIEEAGSEQYYRDEKRVPTYYWGADLFQGSVDPVIIVWRSLGITTLIATVFGAVHCVAWSFYFPSEAERTLWRAASMVISVLPLTAFVGVCFTTSLVVLWRRACHPYVSSQFSFWEVYLALWKRIWTPKFKLLLKIMIFMPYIIARYILLLQALVSLRALPREAYTTVRWTTFIPHI